MKKPAGFPRSVETAPYPQEYRNLKAFTLFGLWFDGLGIDFYVFFVYIECKEVNLFD